LKESRNKPNEILNLPRKNHLVKSDQVHLIFFFHAIDSGHQRPNEIPLLGGLIERNLCIFFLFSPSYFDNNNTYSS
jgi:hypothetical protein